MQSEMQKMLKKATIKNNIQKELVNDYERNKKNRYVNIDDEISLFNPNIEYNKLTKITLNKQRVNCKVNEISKIDIVSLEPNNADNKQVLFASSDSDVVIITEEGQFIAIKKGRATITVTAKTNRINSYHCNFQHCFQFFVFFLSFFNSIIPTFTIIG